MNRFYMWENFANYNNTFGKHTINAMVGMSYQYEWSNFTSYTYRHTAISPLGLRFAAAPQAWAAE